VGVSVDIVDPIYTTLLTSESRYIRETAWQINNAYLFLNIKTKA